MNKIEVLEAILFLMNNNSHNWVLTDTYEERNNYLLLTVVNTLVRGWLLDNESEMEMLLNSNLYILLFIRPYLSYKQTTVQSTFLNAILSKCRAMYVIKFWNLSLKLKYWYGFINSQHTFIYRHYLFQVHKHLYTTSPF